MLEVPSSGEYHAYPILIGSCDDFIVFYRAAGLHYASHASLGKRIHRVVVVRETEAGKVPVAVISDSDLVCDMADVG